MPETIWEREKEPFLDDKWFFYLTLFLVLFAISLSLGLIHRHDPINGLGKASLAPKAEDRMAINNPTLSSGGR